MSDREPLTDEQVHDRLIAASSALGTAAGRTLRGNTAIEAARSALALLQIGLIAAMETGADQVPGVLPSTDD